jgi:hypothetical protein
MTYCVRSFGDRPQAGEADQHHVEGPHPGVDHDDGPGREIDAADHGEGTRRGAGEETDEIVEGSDLGLKQQRPEVSDDRRRKHRRQQDHGRPEAMAAESLVDQQRQAEPDDDLERDGPDHRNAQSPENAPKRPRR